MICICGWGGVYAHMSEYRCPGKPEEGVQSPAGITSDCEPPYGGEHWKANLEPLPELLLWLLF